MSALDLGTLLVQVITGFAAHGSADPPRSVWQTYIRYPLPPRALVPWNYCMLPVRRGPAPP